MVTSLALPQWLAIVLVAAAVSQIATFATSIYLHRGLTHLALTVHPALDAVFRVILWLTTGQERRQWVAVHRKHHAFTDKEGDPHSPLLLGFWKVQLGNAFYYMREARNRETVAQFAPDLKPDLLDRHLFRHGWPGLAAGITALCVALGWWQGLLAAAIHTVLYVFLLAPLINGLGHWAGQQNFANTAYNSRVLALFTGGESLHNNHHAHPRAPRFSMRRGEFDPSWPIIRGLERLGLIALRGKPVS